MVVTKSLKNGKKKVTSTYFDDIKMYRQMLKDDFESLGNVYHRKSEDVSRVKSVQLSAVAQQMMLSKAGCYEVAEYIKQYKGDLSQIVADYGYAKPAEDYDEMLAERDALAAKSLKEEEDYARIDELTAKIQDWDDYITRNLNTNSYTND